MQSPTSLLILVCIAVTSAQGQNQTATSVSAAPATANLGQAVMLTATVNPSNAMGKTTFYDGATILGVAPISNGSASLVTIGIGYGKRMLTARYSGDSNHAGSVSPSFSEHIITQQGGALVEGTGTAYLDGLKLAPAYLADLNHDGNADVVAMGGYGGPAVWLYLSNGDGTFQPGQSYLPGVGGYSAAVADINMDGNPDLLVTSPTGLTSMIGKGDGTFTAGSAILDATDLYVVRVADINADGKADLLILRSTSPAIEILFGNGDGTFQTSAPVMLPLSSPPYDLLVADFNGDGIPDLAVAIPVTNCVTVFLGTGQSTFGAPVAYTSYGAGSIVTADLRNDGKLDLLVGNPYGTFDLLLANGDGTFQPARSIAVYEGTPLTLAPSPVGSYDFDGDGNADVLVTDGNGDLFILLGNGDGTFRAPLQFLLFGSFRNLLVGDLNHDGVADLVASGLPPAIQPWLGALAPVFNLTSTPTQPMNGQPVTLDVTCNYSDATGTVTLEDIEGTGTPLGTAQLVNGSAKLPLGQIATGPHIIHGTYSGNSKYAATNLPPLFLEVQQSIGSVAFTVLPNPAPAGQSITMTATVPNVGNASIAFFDGTTPLNKQTLYPQVGTNSETATFTTTLAAGVHQLTALFPPYLGYLSASATVVEDVLATPGGNLVPGLTYHLSSTITQAVALDLNLDGLIDLAILDPGKSQVSVLLNGGFGVFQNPVATPLSFAPGAMVGTGISNYYDYSAFAITDPAGNSVYEFQDTGGQLAVTGNISVGQQPVAIATADFDRDGSADLATANAGSNNVTLILSGSANPVTISAGNHPSAIVAGDFNHDGKADLAVTNQDDNDVMVFLGNGDGTFKSPTITSLGASPSILLAQDLNGDFLTDLVVIGSGSNQIAILLSNGDGTFRTSATYALGSSASAADLVDVNGANTLDLVVATASGLTVFAGNGNGTFNAPTNYPQYAGAASLAGAPFSGDGHMDLAITLPAAGSVSLAEFADVTPGLRLISMAPCRVVDTRDATKPSGFGPPSMSGGTARSFPIPTGPCDIPSTSQAYSLNVTVVPHGELGYLTVWPSGQSQPLASTLNSLDGEVKANAAIVPGGTGGSISVFATNDTDVVLDINGYFVPAADSNVAFFPMTPCRLVDTRPGAPLTIITGTLTAGSTTALPILSSSCHVPAAQAYSLNFTLVPPGPVGYLTVYPTGESRPVVSTLNDPTGAVEANAAIAPAGSGGSIDVFVTNTTDLVVDINGYFAPVATGGLSLYTLPPCRVLDTRTPSGAPPFVGAINVKVIGSGCGATSAAQAYVLNATVVPQGPLGYLTLWPEGNVQPVVSTLNAYDGDVTSNMAIVPTSNTEISAFATNSTYLVLDLFGYFAP